MKHELEVHDGAESKDSTGIEGAGETRQTYRVTAKAGLFKNGRAYEAGETIMLHPKTAAAFMAIGEVEEVK